MERTYKAGRPPSMASPGSFWGSERIFRPNEGGWVPSAISGSMPNTTNHQTTSGRLGHTTEVLLVVDPQEVFYADLLHEFWESHDPTQGMRQGNDVGTTYRSAIYTYGDAQHATAIASLEAYQASLTAAGQGRITTEITPASEFYFAEEDHQQYLAKNPYGYCNLRGTGVSCPIPQVVTAA